MKITTRRVAALEADVERLERELATERATVVGVRASLEAERQVRQAFEKTLGECDVLVKKLEVEVAMRRREAADRRAQAGGFDFATAMRQQGQVGRPLDDALDAQMMAYAQTRAMGSGGQGLVERKTILEELGLPPDKNDRMALVLDDIEKGKLGLGAIGVESDRAAAEAELAEERERIAETRKFFG